MLLEGIQNGTISLEKNLAGSYKVKHKLTTRLSSSLSLRQMKTYVHTETCTQMFAAALFIIVKLKLPKCLSIDKWKNSTMFIQWNTIE